MWCQRLVVTLRGPTAGLSAPPPLPGDPSAWSKGAGRGGRRGEPGAGGGEPGSWLRAPSRCRSPCVSCGRPGPGPRGPLLLPRDPPLPSGTHPPGRALDGRGAGGLLWPGAPPGGIAPAARPGGVCCGSLVSFWNTPWEARRLPTCFRKYSEHIGFHPNTGFSRGGEEPAPRPRDAGPAWRPHACAAGGRRGAPCPDRQDPHEALGLCRPRVLGETANTWADAARTPHRRVPGRARRSCTRLRGEPSLPRWRP